MLRKYLEVLGQNREEYWDWGFRNGNIGIGVSLCIFIVRYKGQNIDVDIASGLRSNPGNV